MKKFTKRNESFICIHCKSEVSPHPTSSRDHCPFCLYGLHVDIYPGDRANTCKGILEPIGIKNTNRKEQIIYKCEKCGEEVNCITAPDDLREEVLKILVPDDSGEVVHT